MGSFNFEVELVGNRTGGAGDEFLSKIVDFPELQFSENARGLLEGNSVRAALGAPVDEIDYTMTHRDTEIAASLAPELIITETPALSLTPSADTADLDQDLDFPQRFQGRVRVGGNITFTGNGDFTIVFGLKGVLD